ncbi:hypothetical protein [Tissierella praeacuta]|uniref:hypothetical protein n=1 Tax=Tissierella praeacuta TaxID=43131 RepID=UPI002898C85B|nr:hypothetical protein [Tissierella praeacuta]
MRSLNHFSYIAAIDLELINDEEDKIIQAIVAFKSMYYARIIIFAEKADINLLNRIVDETQTYNIITDKDIEKIIEEIRICVSPQGMNKEYLLKSMNTSMDFDIETITQYSFTGENIKIIIAGAMRRVGTTTTAMNMASYLSSIGAKVSYTEANGNSHLEKIHSYFFFNIPITSEHFSQDGVDYFFNGNIPMENYNFNIIDIGTLNERNLKVFEIGEIKMLCSGIKPYEIPQLHDALDILNRDDIDIILSEGKISNVKKELLVNQDKIHYTKFSSDLFDNTINSDVWKVILSKYIIEHKIL